MDTNSYRPSWFIACLAMILLLAVSIVPADADHYRDNSVTLGVNTGDVRLSITLGDDRYDRYDRRYRYDDHYRGHWSHDQMYCETYHHPYTHQHCYNDHRYDHRMTEREHQGRGRRHHH